MLYQEELNKEAIRRRRAQTAARRALWTAWLVLALAAAASAAWVAMFMVWR